MFGCKHAGMLACWLSDSSRLSDIGTIERLLVVRFFVVIGHRDDRTLAACPILSGYRTSELSNACWLSDSSHLSDIGTIERLLVVRFFAVIGHRDDRTLARLSDSSRLSDIETTERSLLVRFFPVIGHRNYRTLAACPILSGYRTSELSNACWLSDSFRLSDIGTIERLLLVRFFPVIGHPALPSLAGCPILRGYRTSELSNACWLSDSSRLSDIGTIERLLVVRFFAVIGQAAAPKANHNKEGHPQSGHPLLLFIK